MKEPRIELSAGTDGSYHASGETKVVSEWGQGSWLTPMPYVGKVPNGRYLLTITLTPLEAK